MTVDFVLNGQKFVALNGGPQFSFDEAISFQIPCADQDEVDRYWSTLSEGGEEGPCGWLKDRFGLSWQVVPNRLSELMSSPDAEVRRPRRPGAVHHEHNVIDPARSTRAGSITSGQKGDAQRLTQG